MHVRRPRSIRHRIYRYRNIAYGKELCSKWKTDIPRVEHGLGFATVPEPNSACSGLRFYTSASTSTQLAAETRRIFSKIMSICRQPRLASGQGDLPPAYGPLSATVNASLKQSQGIVYTSLIACMHAACLPAYLLEYMRTSRSGSPHDVLYRTGYNRVGCTTIGGLAPARPTISCLGYRRFISS